MWRARGKGLRRLVAAMALASLASGAGPGGAWADDRGGSARQVHLANGAWEPYQGPDLPGGGPATRIATAAFTSQGWHVDYHYMPWARGERLARQGRLDGTLVYSPTEERRRRFLFSDPVLFLENRLFHHVERPVSWRTPKDLEGLTIGGVLGYDYDVVRNNPHLDIRLELVTQPILNFRKLARQRIDAVISNARVGQRLIEEAGVGDVVAAHPRPINREPYFLMVSRAVDDAAEIIEAFNAGLAELRRTGRYQELLNGGES